MPGGEVDAWYLQVNFKDFIFFLLMHSCNWSILFHTGDLKCKTHARIEYRICKELLKICMNKMPVPIGRWAKTTIRDTL